MLPSRVGQHDNCRFVVLDLPSLQEPVRRGQSGAVCRIKRARTSGWDSGERHCGSANEKNTSEGSKSHSPILRHYHSGVKETIKVRAITRITQSALPAGMPP
jgi:hypothetical protein